MTVEAAAISVTSWGRTGQERRPQRWSRSPRASRISGRAILVRVECAACGHDVLITRSALLQGLRLQPTDLVLDLGAVALPVIKMSDPRHNTAGYLWGEIIIHVCDPTKSLLYSSPFLGWYAKLPLKAAVLSQYDCITASC